MTAYLYFLLDPRNGREPQPGEHAYVGVTISPTHRLRGHLKTRSDSYNARWITALRRLNLKPVLSVRCVLQSEELAFDLERKMIVILRSRGVKITNTAEGGKGGNTIKNMTLERIVQMRLKQKASFTPERRLQISLEHIGKPIPLDRRQRISRSMRIQMTDAQRLSRSLCHRGRKDSAETREKKRLKALARYAHVPFPPCTWCGSPTEVRTRKYCSRVCYVLGAKGKPKHRLRKRVTV